MEAFYHYTTHTYARGIKKDGKINPSDPKWPHNQKGVWLTKKSPGHHTKEYILRNNYEYDDVTVERKLRRAACYVEIYLPLERVVDLCDNRNNDCWIWQHGPLVLAEFAHRFGVTEGTEDLYLKEGIMAAGEAAYYDSCRDCRTRIQMMPESKGMKIKQNVKAIFLMILESKYFMFDSDDPRFAPDELIQKICVFLFECAISNDPQSFGNS